MACVFFATTFVTKDNAVVFIDDVELIGSKIFAELAISRRISSSFIVAMCLNVGITSAFQKAKRSL